jgi:peptide/nickel transport system permease protein
LVHGTAYSLAAACAATLVSLSLGVLLGLVAGYYGGWVDEVVMRFAEMFVALPWLYLLLAARAFLPLDLDARGAFFLIVTLIGMIGWARPARLVRGMVLSVRQHDYVSASRGFGATDRHVLREHVLPQTYAVVLPQAAILLPHYMLAEVSLSFFGLGVPEPAASLGNVLAPLQRYHVLVSYWWMFLPALTVVVITLMYQMVANSLEERLKCAGC